MSSACNCCEAPPCPVPVLEFLSISSYVECPNILNPEDGLYYDTKKTTDIYGIVNTETWTKNGEGECELTGGCIGETTQIEHQVAWRIYGGGLIYRSSTFNFKKTFTGDCSNPTLHCFGPWEWWWDVPGDYQSDSGDYDGDCSENNNTAPYVPVTFPPEDKPDDVVEITYDPALLEEEIVEYLNENLIFPAWHTWTTPAAALVDGQGYLDFALKSEGKVKTRVKWRIKNLPTGTCYLKVWIQKTFTPDPTEEVPDPAPVITIIPVESVGMGNPEWEGIIKPCLQYPLLGADHVGNTIHTTEVLNPDPSVDGNDTFEILKYACVPGYEPDLEDPTKPNGYPFPTAG